MLKHQSHWSGHCDSSLSTGLLHSILLSCTLNSGLAVSTESTRVLIWQPFGYVRPRDLSSTTYSNPPPTATKNSPGEKCYYEKEWLLCDSHCFIKDLLAGELGAFLWCYLGAVTQRVLPCDDKHGVGLADKSNTQAASRPPLPHVRKW